MVSGGRSPAARESYQRQSPIAVNTESDAAALLAASRELVAEARRILAEAPKPTWDQSSEMDSRRPLVDEEPTLTHPPKEFTRRLTRRLVGVVPAAAGIALLGAGIADLADGRAQHALTVDLRRPAGNLRSASTPSTSVFAAPSSLPPEAAGALPVPVSVSVPRLHSTASVAGEVHVQTSGPENGLLDAPSDYHQLGWYRNGDTGTLVLDGHVGFRTDPGPLAFIGSLGQGDVVTANFAPGQRNFAVAVVGRAVKGQLPQQYFSHQYDGDLMLITCDYTSPFRAGHFADNVYVVALPAQ